MTLSQTVFFYVLIGLACGLYLLRQPHSSRAAQISQSLVCIAFWPILFPLLLRPKKGTSSLSQTHHQLGPFATQFEALHQRIQRAIQQAHNITSELLREEQQTLDAVFAQALSLDQTLAELDQTLQEPTFHLEQLQTRKQELLDAKAFEAVIASTDIQIQNARQLRQLRDQHASQLEEWLLQLEQLHSQLIVLRFTEPTSPDTHTDLRQLLVLFESLQEGLHPLPNPPHSGQSSSLSNRSL